MQSCGLLALCEAELQTEEVDLDRAYPDSKALCEKESEEKKKKEKHVNNTTFQNGRLRRTTTLLGEQITSANTILLGSSELKRMFMFYITEQVRRTRTIVTQVLICTRKEGAPSSAGWPSLTQRQRR